MLLESGLEPARAEPAALHPLGCERGHGRGHRPRVEIGRTHDLERPRRPAPLGERGPFQQDGAGEAARHPEVRGVGAGVHPGAFAEWPAESRTSRRRPVLHRDDLALDIEAERAHEPAGELSQREAVTHRQRSSADEALPPLPQAEPFDRSTDGVRPIEDPHALLPSRRFLEDVAQGGDEGVDAATDVLQIDEEDVEGVHHRRRRPAHLAVQAEDRDPVHGVDEVGRLHHVVLLVAPEPVLGTEGRRQADVTEPRERVERVHECARLGGRMGEERHSPAGERSPQRGIIQQAIETEAHAPRRLPRGAGCLQPEREAVGVMEVGPTGRVAKRPVGKRAARGLEDRCEPEPE